MRKESVTGRAFRLYSAYNPKYFPLYFVKTVFSNLSPYFNLWMSSEIVTALYEGREKRELIILVAVILLGNLFVQVIRAILDRLVQTAEETLSCNEEEAFNRKTLSLDYDKLENPEIRQLRRRITDNAHINDYGVKNMRYNVEALMSCLTNLVFSLALFTEMLALIARLSFQWLGLLLLAAMVAAMTLNVVFQFRADKQSAANWEKLGDLMLDENRYGRGYSHNGLDGRIYRLMDIVTKIIEQQNLRHLQVFSDVFRVNFRLSLPTQTLSMLLQLFSYLIACFYCVLGVLPVGSVIKYVGYLGRITGSIGSLFSALSSFKANERFLATYLEFFDINNDMYQGSLSVEKRSDKKFDIEFRNVSFRYAGTENYALKRVNLRLKVGERLAIVGMNGSGKSTLIKLLCRLYDPTDGEIYMNDFDIRKYDYRQYLDLFSVVFQDYNLLAVPLGNNVSSAAAWDTGKAETCLYEVGFGERYQEMPKKLETPLYKNFDEDGVNISGGEAQKIALARALYRDAPFMILDEPTAALDPIAEAEIYAKFDEIVGDKTAIYISHRLSSCRFCDKILVLDGGETVQFGTHNELVADKSGKYYELWCAQAQYYTEKK